MRRRAMPAPPARSACVLVTSGPGATNAVTGLTDALMDSIPLVCITGQVPTHLIGSDAFQEADTVGITRHCTKHNYLVKNIEDLPRILHEAFYVARTAAPALSSSTSPRTSSSPERHL
jgi:acetolactate synthase-1/2/3 large subunit